MKLINLFFLSFLAFSSHAGPNDELLPEAEQQKIMEMIRKQMNDWFTKPVAKIELEKNIVEVVSRCQNLVKTIANKPQSLWNPKLGFFDSAKKKELAEINKLYSYSQYLNYINDMKIKIGTFKAPVYKFIDEYKGDMKTLSQEVYIKAKDFAFNTCIAPVQSIQNALNRLEKLQTK